MANVEKVKKSVNALAMPVLGTFEGECINPKITNNNGMDITDDVMNGVLDSDDYARGIEYGWFIGFLGHPEDPNCMDFRNGCIVMREMHYGDDGKMYGTWDLLDTPVGQIVKTYIDAGVKFGISIRGAGDLIGSEVQADTFVFRGFDLVSFPAYNDSIPEFTAIAASTDLATQKKYKAICAAIRSNLQAITSATTLAALKDQLPTQAEERKLIDARIAEIQSESVTAATDISEQRIVAMTDLYLNTLADNSKLASDLDATKLKLTKVESASRRKLDAVKRIVAAQQRDINTYIKSSTATTEKLEKQCRNLRQQYVTASTEVKNLEKSNLIYQQDLEAANAKNARSEKLISSLRARNQKTVLASSQLEKKASNLDEDRSKLRKEKELAEARLAEFQNAYASLYASMMGSEGQVAITASMSVSDVRNAVAGATNTSSIAAYPDTDFEEDVDYTDEFASDFDDTESFTTL